MLGRAEPGPALGRASALNLNDNVVVTRLLYLHGLQCTPLAGTKSGELPEPFPTDECEPRAPLRW